MLSIIFPKFFNIENIGGRGSHEDVGARLEIQEQ